MCERRPCKNLGLAQSPFKFCGIKFLAQDEFCWQSEVFFDSVERLCVSFQKEQLNTKGRPFRGMSEEEVFTEVANLFRGQEDLLSEFGQFLPEAKRSLVRAESRAGY